MSVGPGVQFDVVQGGVLVGVGRAFNADGVAGAQGQARNATAGGGVGVGFDGGEVVVGEPLVAPNRLIGWRAQPCNTAGPWPADSLPLLTTRWDRAQGFGIADRKRGRSS